MAMVTASTEVVKLMVAMATVMASVVEMGKAKAAATAATTAASSDGGGSQTTIK